MHLSCSGLEPWHEDRGMGLWELQVPLEEPLPTPTPCDCVANGTGDGGGASALRSPQWADFHTVTVLLHLNGMCFWNP